MEVSISTASVPAIPNSVIPRSKPGIFILMNLSPFAKLPDTKPSSARSATPANTPNAISTPPTTNVPKLVDATAIPVIPPMIPNPIANTPIDGTPVPNPYLAVFLTESAPHTKTIIIPIPLMNAGSPGNIATNIPMISAKIPSLDSLK